MSGGETAYLYKGFSRHEKDPTFSLSSKIKDKEGLYFRAPIGNLQKNPYAGNNSNSGSDNSNQAGDGMISKAQMDKEAEEDKKAEKKEKKSKKKKKPPTTKEIREHIEKMIMMHAKMVQEETPVLYPLLLESQRKKRKKNSEGGDVEVGGNGKRNINMAGLPICYSSNGTSSSKYHLAGQTGKVLR